MKITLELSEADARKFAKWMRADGASLDEAIALSIGDQLGAQIPKPRIPEPSLWGVVYDRDGFEWVRTGITHSSPKEWRCTEDGSPVEWDFIPEPTLIREGI